MACTQVSDSDLVTLKRQADCLRADAAGAVKDRPGAPAIQLLRKETVQPFAFPAYARFPVIAAVVMEQWAQAIIEFRN